MVHCVVRNEWFVRDLETGVGVDWRHDSWALWFHRERLVLIFQPKAYHTDKKKKHPWFELIIYSQAHLDMLGALSHMWIDFQGTSTVLVSQVIFRKHGLSYAIQGQKRQFAYWFPLFPNPHFTAKWEWEPTMAKFIPCKSTPVKTRRGVGLVNSVPKTTLTDLTLTDLEFGHGLPVPSVPMLKV